MPEGGEVSAEIDPAQFKALMAEIKEFDPMLARALRKRLRVIGGEIVTAMQAEVRRGPSKGGSGHSTRSQIAAGIGVKVATSKKAQGVMVTGSVKKMAAGRYAMPRALNKDSWRHPVFGTKKFVSQRGNPYFGRTIKGHEAAAEAAVNDALREAMETVTSGTIT